MPAELKPKLLIGIGTSGMYILENVQRYYYETFKVNKPNNVEYIYLETYKNSKVGVTPLENEIKRVYLDLDQLGAMVRDLKKVEERQWLPPEETAIQAGLGAGGIRCIGRISLWGTNQNQDNFATVLSNLLYSKQLLSQINNVKPTVYIVGSLTGGTGSAVFIDLAYIIRHVFPEIKEVFGLFLLPPNPVTLRGNEVIYANTYAALKDLHYYNLPTKKYSEYWPNGTKADYSNPPYELVQFISQDYSDGSAAISSLPGLYKIAGLYLFLQISGVTEKRMERLIDASGNSIIGKYGMFGLSAIEFPKDQIQEILALNLSEELLKKWVDSQYYYSLNQKTSINKAEIDQKVEEKYNNIIDDAFDRLNTVEGNDLISEIRKEAEKINRKEIPGEPDNHIKRLFGSSETDKLYQRVFYNVSNAVSKIIEGIYDEISNALNKTENLHYTKHVLTSFSNSIDRSIKYFQTLGISESSLNWDNFLRDKIDLLLKNLYKPVFEQDNVLKDRLITLFEMMKMHLLLPKLEEIKENISSAALPLISTNERKNLPQTELLNKLITQINETIGRTSSDKDVGQGDIPEYVTIARRKSEVFADINDTSIPVKRIYRYNDFETECKNALDTYKQKLNRSNVSKKDIIEEKNLFEFLKELLSKNIHAELYTICIKKYRQTLSENDIIPDYDVASFLINNHKLGIQYANRSLTNLLRLQSSYVNPHPESLPRFIACADTNKISELIKSFHNEGFIKFKDSTDGKLLLENLKNMVVFFSEDPLQNPLIDISYTNQMKQLYEKKPSWIQDPTMNDELWVRYRNAYSTND